MNVAGTDVTAVTPQERAVLDWLAGQGEAMQALLANLVNIDSGSHNKAGVDRVGAEIRRFFDANGVGYETIPNATYGDCIRATVGAGEGRTILLMGHRDTVLPDGEARRRPFTVQGGRGHGPGVCDMKAGLTMNAFVAAALKKFGGAPAPVVALFTADEEIGSPSSRALIQQEARKAALVLNAEPGRPENAVVTGRKGGVFMRFEVTGKAAHAGANFEQGASAIAEIAHKIVALQALTDLQKGVTVNVGVVQGGQTINTIAPSARGQVEVRYVKPDDRASTLAKIEAIMAQSTVPGTSGTFEVYAEFSRWCRRRRPSACSSSMPRAGARSARPSPRCSPAAARTPASRRRWARPPCARPARSAAARTAPTSSSNSQRSPRARRCWRSRCCGVGVSWTVTLHEGEDGLIRNRLALLGRGYTLILRFFGPKPSGNS